MEANKPTNLYLIKDGQTIAWVNKGYRLEVILKEGEWYLVKATFANLAEAWVKASDVDRVLKDYLDLVHWARVPLLIEDKLQDLSLPNSCDFKSLKVDSDEDFIYFLIEFKENLRKLLEKTMITGNLGNIYLDLDNAKQTGCGGKEGTPIIGADYKIQIDAGFSLSFQSNRHKTVKSNIGYKLYRWKDQDSDWELQDEKEPILQESFLGISVSKKIVGLAAKEQTAWLIFEENNASQDNKYNSNDRYAHDN